jgi:uncharacterized protein involved in exopolysaccharide biosynthesis
LQRYFETLFRRKELLIIPLLIVPIITMAMTVVTGRQYEVIAAVWVEPGTILSAAPTPGVGRVRPNEEVIQSLTDRMKTENVRISVMERSGLSQMVANREWPVPTNLQLRLDSNPYTRLLAKAIGQSLPENTAEAEKMALEMIFQSIKVIRPTEESDNLVVIKYVGPDPVLGQRLVEETIRIQRESTLTLLIEESDLAVQFFTRNLDKQVVRMAQASDNVQRFLVDYPEPLLGTKRPPEEEAELVRLERELRLETTLYESSLKKLEDVRLEGETAIATHDRNIRVLDPPEAPDETVGVGIRKLAMMFMMGGTLGAMLGIVSVVVATWKDDTVWSRADIERTIGIDSVASVPLIRVGSPRRRRYLMDLATGLISNVRSGS